MATAMALLTGLIPATPDARERVRERPGYALLGPAFARGNVDPAASAAVVSRARAFLQQEPRPAAHTRVEGVSSGQSRAPR